jgi:hypothetical protein
MDNILTQKYRLLLVDNVVKPIDRVVLNDTLPDSATKWESLCRVY